MLVASFLPQIFLLYDFHSSYKHIFFTFGPNLKDLLNLWAKSWGKWSFEKRRRSQMTEGTLTVEHVCCITVLYSDLEQHHYSCQRLTSLPQCHCSCFSHGSWTHSPFHHHCLMTSENNWFILAAKEQQIYLWIQSKFGTCKISVSFFWRAALPASASRRVPAVIIGKSKQAL